MKSHGNPMKSSPFLDDLIHARCAHWRCAWQMLNASLSRRWDVELTQPTKGNRTCRTGFNGIYLYNEFFFQQAHVNYHELTNRLTQGEAPGCDRTSCRMKHIVAYCLICIYIYICLQSIPYTDTNIYNIHACKFVCSVMLCVIHTYIHHACIHTYYIYIYIYIWILICTYIYIYSFKYPYISQYDIPIRWLVIYHPKQLNPHLNVNPVGWNPRWVLRSGRCRSCASRWDEGVWDVGSCRIHVVSYCVYYLQMDT